MGKTPPGARRGASPPAGGSSPTAFHPIRCPSIVGRDHEMAQLRTSADLARTGTGSVVVLVGEPGIGKSRLGRWLASGAGPPLAGRAAPPPSRPLRALAELAGSAIHAGARLDAAELDFYRPTLQALVPHADGDHAQAPRQPLVLGRGILELIDRVPLDGPRIALLEDLHWADPETLLALDQMVDLVGYRPTMLVITARSGENDTVDELVDRWAESRLAQVLRLRPLSQADLAVMVERCLGGTAPAGLVEALLSVVDGSPLLVEEVLDSLVDSQDLSEGEKGWTYRPTDRIGVPRSVAATVRRQLATVHLADRAILRSAAMVSRTVDADLLERMGYAPRDIERAVQAGTAARLLTSQPELGGTAFRHALTQAAVVSVMMAQERQALAAANLVGLERHGVGPDDVEVAAELAGQAGENERRVAYLLQAAQRAVAVGYPSVALTRLDEAVAPAGSDIALVRAIEALRLEALSQSGDVAGARALARRVLPGLRLAGQVAAVYRCQLAVARAEGASGNWANADESLPALDADDLPPDLLSFGAVVALELGDVHGAERLAARARNLSAAAGSGVAECEALEVLGRLARTRSYDEAAALFSKGVEVAERMGLRLWRARALFELGLCEATTTKDGATFEVARAAAVEAGALALSATIDYCLAHLHACSFDTDKAIAVGRRGLDTARTLRLSTWEPRLHLMIGLAHAGAGRRGEARASGQAAREAAPGDVEVEALDLGACQGFASLVCDDRTAAVAEFSRCLELLDSLDFRTATIPWYDLPIVGAVLQPDGLGARAIASVRASTEVMSAVGSWLPLAEAVMAGRAGQGEHAHRLVDGVLAMERELAGDGRRWGRVDFWMRLVAEAALRDGWGDPVAWLSEAEIGLRERGVTTVADECRALLRSAGAGRPRTRKDATVPAALAALGVTRREVEVLELLAERRTNRQIADRLLISPKTVKSHIEHLLAKTGRSDRYELADIADTAGVPTRP